MADSVALAGYANGQVWCSPRCTVRSPAQRAEAIETDAPLQSFVTGNVSCDAWLR